MSYSGRGGHYWYRSDNAIISQGEYYLLDAYGVEFGEPVCVVGTGVTARPFNKKKLKSYDDAAGTVKARGVSIEWREAISTWTDEDYALRGTYNCKRDISILVKGGISVKNVGSGDIEAGDTVIPADGGCEKMSSSGQYSLGVAETDIPSLKRGIIYVDPDYEKPTI